MESSEINRIATELINLFHILKNITDVIPENELYTKVKGILTNTTHSDLINNNCIFEKFGIKFQPFNTIEYKPHNVSIEILHLSNLAMYLID